MNRENALTEYTLNRSDVQFAALYFDKMVSMIEKKEFEVSEPPDFNVCLECDFRMHCSSQGIIKFRLK